MEDVLKKCYDSEEYKEIAEKDKSDIIPGYMPAEEFGKLWEEQLAAFREVFAK